ncbi:MAG: hypothetical protein P8N31_14085 [Planctomycetota bacterium]|nr:hypothetical protein [Planctomycetota bacterium]
MSELPEDLLLLAADVLSGELDRTDPRVVRALEEHPEFAQALEDLSDKDFMMRGAAERQSSDLARADALETAAGEDRVGEWLQEEVRTEAQAGPTKPSRSRSILTALAAAAALIAGVYLMNPGESPGEPPAVWMGDGKVHIARPLDHAHFDVFSWEGSLQPGEEFKISVWNVEPASEREILLYTDSTTDKHWIPTETERMHFAERLHVQIQIWSPRTQVERAISSRYIER